ncbi:MAG: ABC transporter permease, partial [Methanofollis sp.]|nr:ABC transporter permease [Methanofollis sp.]
LPLSLLPAPLQTLALAALPLTHVVNVCRALPLAAGLDLLLLGLLWIAAVTPVAFLLALRMMKKRLIR